MSLPFQFLIITKPFLIPNYVLSPDFHDCSILFLMIIQFGNYRILYHLERWIGLIKRSHQMRPGQMQQAGPIHSFVTVSTLEMHPNIQCVKI